MGKDRKYTALSSDQKKIIETIIFKYENAIYKGIRKFTSDEEEKQEYFQEVFLSMCKNPTLLLESYTDLEKRKTMAGLVIKISFYSCANYFKKIKRHDENIVPIESCSGTNDETYNVVEADVRGNSELFVDVQKNQEAEQRYLNGLLSGLEFDDLRLLVKYTTTGSTRSLLKFGTDTITAEGDGERSRLSYIVEDLRIKSRRRAHLLDFRYEVDPVMMDHKITELENINNQKRLHSQDMRLHTERYGKTYLAILKEWT